MATEQGAMAELRASHTMAVLRASRPTFRNAHDKVAFAVHSSFLAAGFSLLAVGPATNSDDLSSCELSFPTRLYCPSDSVSFVLGPLLHFVFRKFGKLRLNCSRRMREF